MPRKSRPRKNKNRKKTRTDKQVKILAKQAVNSMKPMKRYANDANDQRYNLSTTNWIMIQPYFIGGGPNNSTSAENIRLSNQIWVHRTSGIHWIRIPDTCLYPVEIRKMCGWWKGSTDGQQASINNFSASHLTTSFPNRSKRYDPDNFKIIEDKSWTVMPHQIFDSTSGDTASEDTGLTNANRAVWKPIQIKCNFNINKKVRYSDVYDSASDEPLNQSASLSVGWKPFIGIQVRCPEQQFTDLQGNNPSPVWDSKFTTYFKDNL